MRRVVRSVGVLLVWALGAAAAPAAPVVVSAGPGQGAPGQEVEVPIGVKAAADLGALELRLVYDPAVLEVARVERGPAAAEAGIVDFSAADGRAGMGFASTKGLTGDGVVLKVFVKVKGAVGQKSPLKLEAVRGWEAANVTDVLVTGEDGEFVVVAPKAGLPFPLWWLAVAAGVLLLLVLVVLLRRSGRREPAGAAIPSFGPDEPAFKHECTKCRQTIRLPQSVMGRQFRCAGCGAAQVGGQ